MPADSILLSHSVDPPLSLTCDHNIISFKTRFLKPCCNSHTMLRYNFKKADYGNINKELNNYDWISLIDSSSNLQSFYNSFCDILKSLITKYVPTTKKFKNDRPSYPPHIKKLRKDKILLYRKSKLDRSLKKQYKLKCKEYETAVNIWHDSKELNICNNPSSSKLFKFVNKKLNSQSSIPPLLDANTHLVTSDAAKVELFNKQFLSFFVEDDKQNLNLQPKSVPQMESFKITEGDIKDAIHNMKDKITRTPEEIPSYFIKRCPALIYPLLLISYHIYQN